MSFVSKKTVTLTFSFNDIDLSGLSFIPLYKLRPGHKTGLSCDTLVRETSCDGGGGGGGGNQFCGQMNLGYVIEDLPFSEIYF